MFRMLKNEAIRSLENAIESLDYPKTEIKIDEPPNLQLGDISSNISFKIAENLRKSPIEVSKTIIAALERPEIFSKVENKGPYINFFINYHMFSKLVLKSINEYYGNLDDKKKKIILEHTSANPNGPLHIGHLRNSVIGDSLARLLRTAGYNVETQYYVNDMGRQIAMVVWGVLNLNYKFDDNTNKIDHEIGKLYFKVNEELKNNPMIKNGVDELIKLYEKGEELTVTAIFEDLVQKCLNGIISTLKKVNISHDVFVWESDFVKNGSVNKLLTSLANYISENEVIYIDFKVYGIEKELILLRSDGTSLYSTRDLAYHLNKSKNADYLVDILGSDHKLAIEQLKVVMELLKAKIPDVIFYEFITLPEGSMSTRKGVFISVDELIEESIKRAYSEIKKRRPELNEKDSMDIAEKIGIGAIRYYISKLSPEKHMIFNWDEALSFERGCASIQYAHARACKLLKKSGNININDYDSEDWNLEHPFEKELVKILSKFTMEIENSANMRRVHSLSQYGQDLANAFNKFYKAVPVIGSENEFLRLLIVDKSRITIRNCLNLLGIESPSSM
jgi:arginyl-tRNA synthetase